MSFYIIFFFTLPITIFCQLIISSTPFSRDCDVITQEYIDIFQNIINERLKNAKFEGFTSEKDNITVKSLNFSELKYKNESIKPYCNFYQSKFVFAPKPMTLNFSFDYYTIPENIKSAYVSLNILYLLIEEKTFPSVEVFLKNNPKNTFTFTIKDEEDRNKVSNSFSSCFFLKNNVRVLQDEFKKGIEEIISPNKKENIIVEFNKNFGLGKEILYMKSLQFGKMMEKDDTGVIHYYSANIENMNILYSEPEENTFFVNFTEKELTKNKLYISYELFKDFYSILKVKFEDKIMDNNKKPKSYTQTLNIKFLENFYPEITTKTNLTYDNLFEIKIKLYDIFFYHENKTLIGLMCLVRGIDENEKRVDIETLRISFVLEVEFEMKTFRINFKPTSIDLSTLMINSDSGIIQGNLIKIKSEVALIIKSLINDNLICLFEKGLNLSQFFKLVEEIKKTNKGLFIKGEMA